MCYEQMHALVTAILMAGQLANTDASEVTVSDTADLAKDILDHCDYVTRDKWIQRVAK